MEAGRQGSFFWGPNPAGSLTVPQAHGARTVGVREAKGMRGNVEIAVAISNGPQDGHLLHSAGPPLSALSPLSVRAQGCPDGEEIQNRGAVCGRISDSLRWSPDPDTELRNNQTPINTDKTKECHLTK